MAMMWTTLLMSAIVCTSSQYIYQKENNRCTGNGETMMQIRDLLIQQMRIQESVDSLKQRMTRLEEDVTKTREDVKIVKKELNLYKDCKDLYMNGNTESGVYEICPFGIESKISVFCDMVTEGGGWTAIQKRVRGSTGFNRTWAEYKIGFGNVTDSYWIGNDVIYYLTKGKNSSLYVSIILRNGNRLYELYEQFSISDESDKYRLFLGGPATGTLGDSMLDTGTSWVDLSGMEFSTSDRDNDNNGRDHCAAYWGGGWWFNGCVSAFLNGPWDTHIQWWPTLRGGTEMKMTFMMIKPH